MVSSLFIFFFFFQAEDGIRDVAVTGVQTCALPIWKGHILLAELIGAGEIPVGLTVYNSNAESLKRKGAPIDWLPVDPVVARPQGIALGRNAPHPHAALAFADFVLSPEGQELLSSMGRVPVSTKVQTHMNKFNYTVVDPATVLEEQEKWNRLWEGLFIQK